MRNWLTDCRPSLVNRPTCNQMKGQTSARPPIPKRAGANMRPVPTRWRGEPGRAGGCAQDGPDGRPECLDSNSDGRQAGGAISDSILWSRANDLGGSRSAGFGRGHSDTPSGSRCMASWRDWILRDRSRRPRSLRRAEGRSLVGVTHVHRCAVTGIAVSRLRRGSLIARDCPRRRLAVILVADVGVREHRDGTSENRANGSFPPKQ
jgi:hypothetical protein